ncbi:hypothetical protein EVAR_87323_1 [Eumeta japonica]|uniref:Helitron helicase-like domain-containing protein n=1 Tax=Eumeta variegata TaxID=151549 RepID=A0A4C1SE67_EUMVA|nr:hypothetical protein EVAR_87323_1 [Eumeta japonica]
MDVINKGRVFGEARCFMYSVEWQKRGLPHVHILWLKDKLRPDQIDNIISAEIPDPNIDKTLHDIIVKYDSRSMRTRKSTVPCMKDGKCTKKFPRKLVKETVLNDHGYPQYRRRAPADGGRTATVKLRNGSNVTVDNSWVVPYSPILSKMFNAHINVESCRYVSSNEAVASVRFPLHERHPTVTHLSVHLENGERVYFNEHNFHERITTPPKPLSLLLIFVSEMSLQNSSLCRGAEVKTISGKDLSDYGMIRPQRTEEISSDLIRELDYDTASLQQITESVPRLNPEQSFQEEIPSTSQKDNSLQPVVYTTVSIQEEIPSTSQKDNLPSASRILQFPYKRKYQAQVRKDNLPSASRILQFPYKRKYQAQVRKDNLPSGESYTTVFVQEEMPGTIQERYPIPIEAYATVSIQEEMPGTSEERQPTLSESYTTVFAQEEMAGTSPERQPIPSESYATEVPVLTIPEEFDIVETDFTEIDKQPLVYISGYIASTVVKSLNCVVCEQALQENNPENNPIYSYINFKRMVERSTCIDISIYKVMWIIQDALDILKRSN